MLFLRTVILLLKFIIIIRVLLVRRDMMCDLSKLINISARLYALRYFYPYNSLFSNNCGTNSRLNHHHWYLSSGVVLCTTPFDRVRKTWPTSSAASRRVGFAWKSMILRILPRCSSDCFSSGTHDTTENHSILLTINVLHSKGQNHKNYVLLHCIVTVVFNLWSSPVLHCVWWARSGRFQIFLLWLFFEVGYAMHGAPVNRRL